MLRTPLSVLPVGTWLLLLLLMISSVMTMCCVQISSKQLRDDLMTMLIAGHETTAAVLTWTVYCLTSHPQVVAKVHQEVSIIPHLVVLASASCMIGPNCW